MRGRKITLDGTSLSQGTVNAYILKGETNLLVNLPTAMFLEGVRKLVNLEETLTDMGTSSIESPELKIEPGTLQL